MRLDRSPRKRANAAPKTPFPLITRAQGEMICHSQTACLARHGLPKHSRLWFVWQNSIPKGEVEQIPWNPAQAQAGNALALYSRMLSPRKRTDLISPEDLCPGFQAVWPIAFSTGRSFLISGGVPTPARNRERRLGNQAAFSILPSHRPNFAGLHAKCMPSTNYGGFPVSEAAGSCRLGGNAGASKWELSFVSF